MHLVVNGKFWNIQYQALLNVDDLPTAGLQQDPGHDGIVRKTAWDRRSGTQSTDGGNSLSQDSNTEGTEPTDQQTDNELIRSLREQLKEKDKQLKNAPTRESVEAEIRQELERETAISEQLVALGHPKGLSEFLKGKLEEDAEINRDTVGQALQSIGYQVEVDDAAEQSEGQEPSSQESDLARVGDLSAKVQAAASGGVDPSEALAKKINAATSQSELNQIMEEAGLTSQLH